MLNCESWTWKWYCETPLNRIYVYQNNVVVFFTCSSVQVSFITYGLDFVLVKSLVISCLHISFQSCEYLLKAEFRNLNITHEAYFMRKLYYQPANTFQMFTVSCSHPQNMSTLLELGSSSRGTSCWRHSCSQPPLKPSVQSMPLE